MTTVMTPPVPANAQEAYEFIRAFFIKQGTYGYYYDEVEGVGSCCYRTVKGKKCAAGCLIPDEIYDAAYDDDGVARTVGAAIEGKFVDQTIGYHETLKEIFNGEDPVGHEKLLFISGAQEIHDNHARQGLTIASFIHDLDWLAEKKGLAVVVSS